jgi:hypothetical protein
MLIPLGILAGSGEGFSSDYELIATAFGTGSSGTIEFTSIPADYKHLQIRSVAKRSAGTSRAVSIRFNDITSNSYASHVLLGNATSVASQSSTSQTSIAFDGVARVTTTDAFAASVVDILDYTSASKNTTVRSLSGMADASTYINLSSGFLNNTVAITKITLSITTDNFTSTTRFSLYGLKG